MRCTLSVSHEVVSFMWDSAVLEKRKTIKHCLIIENLSQKNTALVSMGPCVMGISLFIEFVFSYRCYHLFRPLFIYSAYIFFLIFLFIIFIYYYVFKTYVSGYMYYIKWDLKPPCQTRRSILTDFHIWYNPLYRAHGNEDAWNQLLVTSPSLFLVASPLVRGFAANLPNV